MLSKLSWILTCYLDGKWGTSELDEVCCQPATPSQSVQVVVTAGMSDS